jgi:tripartite-type tricarboxylate transporter receptor subunit TctC
MRNPSVHGCIVASLILASAAMASGAAAQSVAEFYKGKILNVVVGAGEAGTNTAYARVIADFLPKYLPGSPTAVVRIMPGAGGLKAANYMYDVAPKDGTYYAVVQRGIIAQPLFGIEQATFDATKINWIGSTAREVSVGVVWAATTEARTIQDATKQEIIVGSQGAGSQPGLFPLVLNHFLGTKFKVVHGYKSGTELTLAMERGEVQGRIGWSWGSLKSRSADWIRDHKVRVLVQMGLDKSRDLPEVPLALDLAKSPEDRDALNLIFASTTIGWPTMMPPNVPADRLQAMRDAFDKTVRDPQFVAQAEGQGLEIDPMSGQEIQAIIRRMYAMPKSVVERARVVIGSQPSE